MVLSKKGTCIFAWAATLLIPVLLVAGVGWPWLERMRALDGQIESLDDRVVRYQRLLRTLPALRAELEKVRNDEQVKAFYFDAKTPALAGAKLQRELQEIVTAAGGRLVSTQILPAAEEEQPPKVRIRTQLQGRTETLLDVLYGLEEARPFLFVDQVSVRSTSRRTAPRNTRARVRRRPATRRPQGQLTVRLDIFGFALGDAR